MMNDHRIGPTTDRLELRELTVDDAEADRIAASTYGLAARRNRGDEARDTGDDKVGIAKLCEIETEVTNFVRDTSITLTLSKTCCTPPTLILLTIFGA